MSQIAVVFTGGTIGSRVTDGVADTAGGSRRLLLDRYRQTHPASAARFSVCEPLSVLSENMTPAGWERLLAALRGLDWEGLDGVVVTHGTDTLAYTAQLLAVALAGISRPVFLVSSHTPPDDPAANGHRHFAAAVDWIENGGPAGVYVPIGEEESAVVKAEALTQCVPLTDRFGVSPCRPAAVPPEGPLLFRLPPLRAGVVLVQPYPGLDYRSVALPEGTGAVLHGLYHSGTACVAGESTGLGGLAACCRERGIPLFAAPAPESPAYEYASARALRELGVRLLPGIPLERGYVLLTLACSLCAGRPQDVPAAAARLLGPAPRPEG